MVAGRSAITTILRTRVFARLSISTRPLRERLVRKSVRQRVLLVPRAVHDPRVLRASPLVRPGRVEPQLFGASRPWLLAPKGRPAAVSFARGRAHV